MIIFPSYLCNFKCPFCGLRKDNSPLMPLDWLSDVMAEIKPTKATILGGEPMLLQDDYLKSLISLCVEATGNIPTLYTNGSIIKPILSKTQLVISYDPEDRERCAAVFNNILTLEQPYDFNTILTKNLVEAGAKKFEQRIKRLSSLKRVDLSLYHRFPGHDDMAASDIDSFLNELTDERIRFIRNPKMKSFEEVVKVLPDQRFLVETPDHNQVATASTIEEIRDHYEKLRDEYTAKL